ncbi:hypothetical protein [Pseudomonas alloputida]|uniref:hypothetical protein n=1 Tax=Pseudomonas TaxID=286 RepID=UPI003EF01833
MPGQNKDQAELLIAEVLAAACLVAEGNAASKQDRHLVRRLRQQADEALCLQQISVYAQVGAIQEMQFTSADDHDFDLVDLRKIVMRKRGRQVVLDLTRLRSFAGILRVDKWASSALRTNLSKAFKLLGQPELC